MEGGGEPQFPFAKPTYVGDYISYIGFSAACSFDFDERVAVGLSPMPNLSRSAHGVWVVSKRRSAVCIRFSRRSHLIPTYEKLPISGHFEPPLFNFIPPHQLTNAQITLLVRSNNTPPTHPFLSSFSSWESGADIEIRYPVSSRNSLEPRTLHISGNSSTHEKTIPLIALQACPPRETPHWQRDLRFLVNQPAAYRYEISAVIAPLSAIYILLYTPYT